ncbi:MAG TPA: hypothetical protein DCL80_03805 [Balneola sp.]|jgi:hypothetical protein|nr:hypothetical protein [Balneola sp.]MAO76747.1 hypothetical protein [Balneola sp.]MBF65154.1 hypothetical protein [Balneola sp.]HAH50418.1 hypothetical protein [Balneola sp.]HAW82330.1 hypothetical protein [Balneola sp.]|tara:strand:+ start:6546 stop:6929 length:384 start_codon:yes stop_codon:yes gene_type:complete
MNRLLIFAALTAFLFSCSNTTNSEEIDEVNIRISNVSEYAYENIIFSSRGNELRFGNLESGESSEYKVTESASRVVFIELIISDSTYTIQPIDDLGDGILEDGKYTLTVDAELKGRYNSLIFDLVED